MWLCALVVHSQLENLYIEKYYISDANDATDTTGGILPVGSTTYRIYANLLPGSAISQIFGDDNHPLSISSTAPFFNHATEGKTFGKDFQKPRLGESLVALDTYITIGQLAKQGPNLYFGLPKTQDTNGSFVGGSNNDGGSEMLPQGLMNNQTNEMGSALTQADGIDTMVTTTASWSSAGILDFFTGNDSTIFGSIVSESSFFSSQFYLTTSFPYDGVNPDSNMVLIAQLTTTGDIQFDLNFEVVFQDNDGIIQTIRYVAKDTLIESGEVYNAFLSYPYAPVGISELNQEMKMLYPNPANDHVVVKGNSVQIGQMIQIFDQQGKCVQSQIITTNGSQTLSIDTLASGVYLVKVGQEVSTLVKE